MLDAWIDTFSAWVGAEAGWQPQAPAVAVDAHAVDLRLQTGSVATQLGVEAATATATATWTALPGTPLGHCPVTPDALDVTCIVRGYALTGLTKAGVAPLETELRAGTTAPAMEAVAGVRTSLCFLTPGHGCAAPQAGIEPAVQRLVLGGREALQAVAGTASPQAAALGLWALTVADEAHALWRFPARLPTAIGLRTPAVTFLSLASGMATVCARRMPITAGMTWRTPVTTTLRIDSPLESRAA